jgi:hypothetical protein
MWPADLSPDGPAIGPFDNGLAMQKFDSDKNYYELLGVEPAATQDEIDRGFKGKAREQHPDRGGSEEDMKLLNEAREILSDPNTRRAYDEERDNNSASSTIPYGSSAAVDSYRPQTAEGLKIDVTDGDFVGLCLGAAACIGLGIPFLVLIHMQYVFFLWPLHYLTLAVLGIGVLMGHAALKVRNRRPGDKDGKRRLPLLQEIGFWTATGALAAVVYLLLYA